MTATATPPKQQTLLVETPPELEWLGPIPLEQIRRGPWGPEPDTQFCRAIEQNGVLQPIIVEQLEPDVETNAGDDDQELLETVRKALELVAQHEEASA